MKASSNTYGAGPTGEGQVLTPGACGFDDAQFDLPRFAQLTYQEYAYCSQTKPINDWLCDTLGICGDNHG